MSVRHRPPISEPEVRGASPRWTRLLAASLAAGLPLACGGPADVDAGPTVRTERGRIERIVVATGTIEPEKEVEVRPRVAGIIERIAVDEGDRVEPGQLLIEIDRDILDAQVREASAAVDAAAIDLRFARIDHERLARLRDQGASSQKNLDDARSRFEGARARLAQARARRDSLEVQQRYSNVSSPLAGRVLHVHVEEGNAVSPVTAVTGGTLLLSLAATDTYHLKGLVDENEIVRVAIGQPARIRTEAFGDRTFAGEVSEIKPVGERVQNVTYFEVLIDVTDPDAQRLLPRMSGDAEIVAQIVEDALFVPETALRYQGDRIYVETVNGSGPGAAEERDVRVGIVDGERVQILEGLEEGVEIRVQ